MTDYYRDRCRHGGILSDSFIRFWWNRQVVTNQYGRAGRAASKWGEDTIEGDLPEDVLIENRNDQNTDNEKNRFLDDEYYSSKSFDLEDIEVPVLSVANWGGILLHLRGIVFCFWITICPVIDYHIRQRKWLRMGRLQAQIPALHHRPT